MCGALQRFTKTAASADFPPARSRSGRMQPIFLLWDLGISLLWHCVLQHGAMERHPLSLPFPFLWFFFFCCIFFPPLPSSFPLPLCPSAPRTVSSRGEKKPGMNGNQARRPLAVSPPRRTGRRQELSVPLSCVPWGWDLTEIPSSPLPQPATQCPLLQPKEQTQHQEISELGQGWEEDCMCSSPGEQTGVRPAHDNRINH